MKQFFSKYFKYICLLTVFVFGLTPLIWFIGRKGILITGSDTNFPLNPAIWFGRRFFVWQNISNGGSNFASSTAGVFFHFLQFLPYKLGFSLQIVEMTSLLFWFLLIVFSSFFLSKLIFPRKNISQLVFVTLYSFNIYLFNSWENVKVANLALVAAIPLGISILILLKEKKIRYGLASLFALATGIVVSGAGINPAYIICFFTILFIFQFSVCLVNFRDKKFVIQRVIDMFLVSIFIIGVNLFWILPTLQFIFGSITPANSIDKLGYTNWVNSLSANTSLINVLRMQGAWDWYSFDSISNTPLYIPYAVKYFYNPFFIAFSFLVPSLALLSYVIRKKISSYLYFAFGIMLFLGIFLTAGAHEPTGGLFIFLSRHVPFFSLFRSPWYIFAPLVGLSIAGLVGTFFSELGNRLPEKFYYIFAGVFVFCSLLYSYPLITGKIFRPSLPNNFYIQFPEYVYQSRDWLNKSEARGRIISYPDDNIENFKWGYAAVDSLLSLLASREIVFSSINNSNAAITNITNEFYKGLKKNELDKIAPLAIKLGVGQIFYKKDQSSLAPPLPDSLTKDLAAHFGDWYFYNYLSPDNVEPKIHSATCCMLGYPHEDAAQNLTLLNKDQTLVDSNDSLLAKVDLAHTSGAVVHAQNSQENDFQEANSSFDLKSKFLNRDLNKVNYYVDINQDGNYSPVLEKYSTADFGIIENNKVALSLDGVTQNWSIANSNDSYIYFQGIFLTKGKHIISIDLKNKNLVGTAGAKTVGEGDFSLENGVYSILNKSERTASYEIPITNFIPGANYFVSVEYKQIYGNTAEVLMDQKSNSTLFKSQNEQLSSHPDWQVANIYYSSIQANSNFYVNLNSPPTKDVFGTKVLYRKLMVYRVFENDMFFIKKPEVSIQLPNVNFKMNSPVSYSGFIEGVKGANVLVFNETYSPDWELRIEGNPSAQIIHFTANSYANGWYIKNVNGNYKFTVYYKPQKLLIYGYIASGGVVLLSIFCFVYYLKKK